MRALILFALILFSGLVVHAQSKTVADFEKNTNGYKVFLYQSVIRMFNKDKNPEFNRLIRDLDHLRFILSDSTGADAIQAFKRIDGGIRDEGFTQIMSVDNKDYRYHVYELTSKGGKTTWVATLYMNGRAGLIEMRGSLNLKYLKALTSMNWDQLKDALPMEGVSASPKEGVKADTD